MLHKFSVGHLRTPHKIVLVILVKPESDFTVALWVAGDITFQYDPEGEN